VAGHHRCACRSASGLLREALDRASSQEGLVAALTPSGFVDDEDAARWSMTTAEFAAAVMRLQETAAAAVAAQRRHEEQSIALLKQHCRRLPIRPALPLPHVVVMLGALGSSLALCCGVDPGHRRGGHRGRCPDRCVSEER
jgi:hypothetical protein